MLVPVNWLTVQQVASNLNQVCLQSVENVTNLVEVLLVLDFIGVGLSEQWMVDHLEMLHPLLGRRKMHTE